MAGFGYFVEGLGESASGIAEQRQKSELDQQKGLLDIIKAGGVINPSKDILEGGAYQIIKFGAHKVAFPTKVLSQMLEGAKYQKAAAEAKKLVSSERLKNIGGWASGMPGFAEPAVADVKSFVRPEEVRRPAGFGAGMGSEAFGRAKTSLAPGEVDMSSVRRRVDEFFREKGMKADYPGMKAKKPLSYSELESRSALEGAYGDQIKTRAKQILDSEGFDSSEESIETFLGDPENRRMLLDEILGR